MTQRQQITARIRGAVRNGVPALASARMVVFAASGISTLILARVLGPREYGIYAAGVAIASLALVLNTIGQDQLFLRHEISHDLLSVRTSQVALMSVLLVAGFAAFWPGASSPTRVCASLFGGAIVCQRLLTPYLTKPLFDLDFAHRARREIAATGVFPVIGFLLGYILGHTPTSFSLGYLLAGLILLIGKIDIVALRRVFRDNPIVDFRRGIPFAISSAFFAIYFQSDIAVLGSMAPAREVGLYAACTALLGVSLLLSTLLCNDVMRSRLYKLTPHSRAFRRTALSTRRVIMLFGVVIGSGVALTAPLLLHIVFGEHFVAGAPYLRVFGLAIVIYYASNWCSNVLIAAGAIQTVVWVQGVLAVVNLGGNVLLIPHFGAAGSAWMTVACEALGMVIFAVSLRSQRTLRLTRWTPTENGI